MMLIRRNLLMKNKIILCGIIFLVFQLSCKKLNVKPETLIPGTDTIKVITKSTKYFVATTGNDNNDGSSGSPFLNVLR
jgi:hypothetical protein